MTAMPQSPAATGSATPSGSAHRTEGGRGRSDRAAAPDRLHAAEFERRLRALEPLEEETDPAAQPSPSPEPSALQTGLPPPQGHAPMHRLLPPQTRLSSASAPGATPLLPAAALQALQQPPAPVASSPTTVQVQLAGVDPQLAVQLTAVGGVWQARLLGSSRLRGELLAQLPVLQQRLTRQASGTRATAADDPFNDPT